MFKYFLIFIVCLKVSQSYKFHQTVNIQMLPSPDEVVLYLSEDAFEDYLDYWLHQKLQNELQERRKEARFMDKLLFDLRFINDECPVPLAELKEPLPIFASNGSILKPRGTTGHIYLSPAQLVDASCPGFNNGLEHTTSSNHPLHAIFTCAEDCAMTTSWIPEAINFVDIRCKQRTNFTTIKTNTECHGGGTKIASTLSIDSKLYTTLTSCFHENRSEVLYVEYEQNPENMYNQPNVVRPGFYQGSHYPGLNVDQLYTQIAQKATFDKILGPSMNEKYINSTFFLSRGHLAAKTDFVLAPEQRSTFSFVNAAPQWQQFNGGNWNTLEQNLRSHIGKWGYRTKIYTGTWDILSLADSTGTFRDIYLNPETKQIPVPLWYYKVVYEPSTKRGIAFLGLNNPHISIEEASELVFCEDICTDNSNFTWLTWRPTDIRRGLSLCCEIDDFKKTVNVLPDFETTGILT